MSIDATLMRFSLPTDSARPGGGYCKHHDTSLHFFILISRGVLMRSILTILLETKNQLEKCYRDDYYFFLEGLGLR